MVLEKDIENKFVLRCAAMGCIVEKYERIGKGRPDRIILTPFGQAVFIEFKRPGGKTSVHQDDYLENLERRHFKCRVFDSYEEALSFIEEIVNEGKRNYVV